MLDHLRALREDRDLSQKDMADFVNGNHNSHVRIHERIDGCNEAIRNHENRLEKLEEGAK